MSDPYAVLGVDPGCGAEDIRAAYRALARRWHPDRHGNSAEANERLRAVNAAYEVLGDPSRRAAHDHEHAHAISRAATAASQVRKITQDVRLRTEEFLRGTTLTVRVNDPAVGEPETYEVIVPEGTAPGTRIRLPRATSGGRGELIVRLLLAPGRFRARGSDLRCDLRISAQRAAAGGSEMLPGPDGRMVRVPIPRGVERHAVLRLPGEGLPKARGGRGDLLARVVYRPEVRVARGSGARGLRRLR